jgi:hypothetical protein
LLYLELKILTFIRVAKKTFSRIWYCQMTILKHFYLIKNILQISCAHFASWSISFYKIGISYSLILVIDYTWLEAADERGEGVECELSSTLALKLNPNFKIMEIITVFNRWVMQIHVFRVKFLVLEPIF